MKFLLHFSIVKSSVLKLDFNLMKTCWCHVFLHLEWTVPIFNIKIFYSTFHGFAPHYDNYIANMSYLTKSYSLKKCFQAR